MKNKKGGYTLLFAVLVSSIVLAVGISILTISKKEFLLSSSARESTSAFYAADSALECATFYTQGDNSNNFSTSTPIPTSINCMGQTLVYSPSPAPATITFKQGTNDTFIFDIKTSTDDNSSACAIVTIQQSTKHDADLDMDIPVTDIISRGYNIGWRKASDSFAPKTCSAPSPKRVERAIEYTF